MAPNPPRRPKRVNPGSAAPRDEKPTPKSWGNVARRGARNLNRDGVPEDRETTRYVDGDDAQGADEERWILEEDPVEQASPRRRSTSSSRQSGRSSSVELEPALEDEAQHGLTERGKARLKQ